MLQQIEQSQWLAPERLLALQFSQLDALLEHARATVPAYRQMPRDARAVLDYEQFRRWPMLTRRDLQNRFDEFVSKAPPRQHGKVQERRTSGSTGAPVRLLTTALAGLYWNAFNLRDHLWHRHDLSTKLAVVRRETEPGHAANWGPATFGVVDTGPTVSNSIRVDAAALIDWLVVERPGYLLTYPSLVAELARLSIDRGVRLDGLREVRTFAESLHPELRQLVREAWGVPLTDVYSATETGYLALQCPQHDHYHVQSEGVLLEVLRDDGQPCAVGEVGRVVVTSLHNFAMPLIRYDIGDFAELGAPCSCGRGLPVLERIHGRVRNTLVTADGKRFWPIFGTRAIMESAPLAQYQFVQKSHTLIEARVVATTQLTAAQESRFCERVSSMLPAAMEIRIVYVESIARSAGGKYEEFLSEIAR